jgi:hypothetical protein
VVIVSKSNRMLLTLALPILWAVLKHKQVPLVNKSNNNHHKNNYSGCKIVGCFHFHDGRNKRCFGHMK